MDRLLLPCDIQLSRFYAEETACQGSGMKLVTDDSIETVGSGLALARITTV